MLLPITVFSASLPARGGNDGFVTWPRHTGLPFFLTLPLVLHCATAVSLKRVYVAPGCAFLLRLLRALAL